MWILFEDDEHSPACQLIKYAYSEVDVNIKFVGGNSNFGTTVDTISDDDCVIIMLDLIPDNSYTTKEYKELRRHIRHRKNTHIIPTLSLDYILLKAFTSHNIDVDYLVSIDYNSTLNLKSLEKYCKYLLDNTADCLSLGRYSKKGVACSEFYKVDCLCRFNKSECKSNYTRMDKGIDLICSMPCFYGVSRNKPIEVFNYEDYLSNFISRHNRIVNRLAKRYNWDTSVYNRAIIL